MGAQISSFPLLLFHPAPDLETVIKAPGIYLPAPKINRSLIKPELDVIEPSNITNSNRPDTSDWSLKRRNGLSGGTSRYCHDLSDEYGQWDESKKRHPVPPEWQMISTTLLTSRSLTVWRSAAPPKSIVSMSCNKPLPAESSASIRKMYGTDENSWLLGHCGISDAPVEQWIRKIRCFPH